MDIPQELSDYITSKLIPINELSDDGQRVLLDNVAIENYPAGTCIFEQGDIDDNVYYLLAGKINMMATDESSFTINADVDQCVYPIGQMQPRQYSAYSINTAQVLKISKTLFNSLIESDKAVQSLQIDTADSEAGRDWMTYLLESRIFANIPPQNIKKIFELFEEVSFKQGERIIKQGDQGDYFYIVKSGRFEVTRRVEKQNKTFKLATLHEGETFGEESLLGDVPRNASITAKTDGVLMRITKDAFLTLIRDPAIKSLNYDTAMQLNKNGCLLLDVRSHDEYGRNALEGSLNFPLDTLRIQMHKLDMESEYIVYCDTGSRSAIAAYLLLGKGYTVSHLQGGIMQYLQQVNMREQKIAKPVTQSATGDQSVRSGGGDTAPARQHRELQGTTAIIESLLSRQCDNDQLSNALRTVLVTVFKQLDQALKGKTEAEIARNIAERKLAALQKQLKEVSLKTDFHGRPEPVYQVEGSPYNRLVPF